MSAPQSLAITSAGTALCFLLRGDRLPVITHWGAAPAGALDAFASDLAATAAPAVMHSSLDIPRLVSILPTQHEGWSGTAGLEVHRGGGLAFVRLSTMDVDASPSAVRFTLADAALGLTAVVTYRLDDAGVLRCGISVTNSGADALEIVAARALLPLPMRAEEILDFTGRWSGERRPQRSAMTDGTRLRAARRGRTGHDAPLLQMVGTPGFAFRSGEVWATHVAWSGDADYLVERLSEGVGAASSLQGGGEALAPGEVALAPGDTYDAPDTLFVHAADGIDGLSARLHRSIRATDAHPTRPRPIVLNTWEAVYFDHNIDRLRALADVAQTIGVERFVLDDGWFQGRRDDRAGLGDWWVDRSVWPDGLRPLADRVRQLGMEFGLWFEPEMVNLDSDVAREHPEWLLAPAGELGPSWRFQYLLNLADPAVYSYLLDAIDAVVSETGVDFIKWDHNRDLHEAVDRRNGRPGVRAHTLATYRLMDELRRRHPGLEIESCASGGARVDLGVLAHTQRIWASDTNDAIERQHIQRWTSVLVPPELIGSHVGPERSHTTGRKLDLSFRLITALFGHPGIEWDVTGCDDDELTTLRAWTALVKRTRELVATGTVVRADEVRDGSMLHGVVAPDGASAVFAWVQTAVGPSATSERIRIPGLDPTRTYRVTVNETLGEALRRSIVDPAWMNTTEPAPFSGASLTSAGLPLPVLQPGQALLLEFSAI